MEDFVTRMRSVVFAGHSLTFTSAQEARHKFGIRLIQALSITLAVSDTSCQHAMLLWTISMSMSLRGSHLDVCVACLIVCAKMNEAVPALVLKRFAAACAHLFQSREHTARTLEFTLKNETDLLQKRVRYLALVLKMFDSSEFARETANISKLHLKYAEIFLLFTSFQGHWYHYLIELHEYILSKTNDMTNTMRMHLILQVCGVENT
jgi:hypothetical protein